MFVTNVGIKIIVFLLCVSIQFLWSFKKKCILNDYDEIKEFGYSNVNEVIGKSDDELIWRSTANQIVENDNIVIREGRSITFEEKQLPIYLPISNFLGSWQFFLPNMGFPSSFFSM